MKDLYKIVRVKGVAAFGAEFRRMRRVGGLPAALVTAVDRRACRALCTAFRAEFAGVHRAAGAGPGVCGGGEPARPAAGPGPAAVHPSGTAVPRSRRRPVPIILGEAVRAIGRKHAAFRKRRRQREAFAV